MDRSDTLAFQFNYSNEVSGAASDSGTTIFTDNSLVGLGQEQLPEGYVEEKFRVDRRKLEAMILGCLPDPWDSQIKKIPISSDGRVMSADEFFQTIMELTNTDIRYPKYLKIGGRSKKDPYVRIIGLPTCVQDATLRVQHDLQPANKITLKMDVPWTGHSHIIGKSGNTIQPVVKKTGVSIHFPDGNKNSEVHKSNQVSINSRGEELSGLEEARSAIRDLTPLIYTFSIPITARIHIAPIDLSLTIMQVQQTYNVQADLQVFNEGLPAICGLIKGTEWDAGRVKEATLFILQSLCGNIAANLIVQMKIDISPQHHSTIIGRNSENLNKIMQLTSTKIIFPQIDGSDPIVPALDKYTVLISGTIYNVYLARQNLIGSLPLVLMFDLLPDQSVSQMEMDQIMQTLDVSIVARSKRADGKRSLILRCTERNASNLYEAWRLLTKMDKPIIKAKIPQTYHFLDNLPFFELSNLSLRNAMINGDINMLNVICNNPINNISKNYAYTNNHDVTLTSKRIDEAKVLFENDILLMESLPLVNSNTMHNNSDGDQQMNNNIHNIMNLIPDRRAPGCEKKHLEANPKNELDYFSQRILAAKVMKRPVTQGPRTPTSNWSGQGFSKSMPGFVLKQLKKDSSVDMNNNCESWNHDAESLKYSPNGTLISDKLETNNNNIYATDDYKTKFLKEGLNMAASDYIEAMMFKDLTFPNHKSSDLNSLLAELQLEQYIDLFNFHGIDLQTFTTLTDQDLKDLGVVLFGHRKKLLMAIKSENFLAM